MELFLLGCQVSLWLNLQAEQQLTCRNSVLDGEHDIQQRYGWGNWAQRRTVASGSVTKLEEKQVNLGCCFCPPPGLCSSDSLSWLWGWRQQQWPPGVSLGETWEAGAGGGKWTQVVDVIVQLWLWKWRKTQKLRKSDRKEFEMSKGYNGSLS